MYLFISDIHGNIENLKKLELSKYDTIFFLGDLYGTIDGDEEVKKFMINNQYKMVCTKGNCDYDGDYLELGIPINEYIHFNENGLNIYCTHGNKYSLSKGNNFKDMNILIYGHEHIPYIEKLNNHTYICVGSVSKPRNSFGPTYMEYENNTFTIKNFDNEIIKQIKISS